MLLPIGLHVTSSGQVCLWCRVTENRAVTDGQGSICCNADKLLYIATVMMLSSCICCACLRKGIRVCELL